MSIRRINIGDIIKTGSGLRLAGKRGSGFRTAGSGKRRKRKKTKRKPSAYNLLVAKTFRENPQNTFTQNSRLASSLWKKK